jgi:glycosyltransferase involved in cell wall biosynthesis
MAWGNAEVQSTLKSIKYSKDVYFTGRLSDEELAGVLGSAEALVYVPLFEGFGIPVVEAMEANVPIICSNVTSLPEVAGDAAILIDPTKPDVIANAMAQIVSSEETKLRLLKNATTQKLKFSWEKSASLLWDSIIKAISSN